MTNSLNASNSDDIHLPSTAFLVHLEQVRPNVIANPSTPKPTANMFIVECFMRSCEATNTAGKITLVRDSGEFFAWDGTRYLMIPEETIKAGLYAFLEYAYYMKGPHGN
jgi:hypothetical protein